MPRTTGIAWTDATFNPWIGCTRVSPACAHCYAADLAANRMGLDVWGDDRPRRVTTSTWKNVPKWNREAEAAGTPLKVFCASLADVFEDHSDLPEPRARLWTLIEQTPWLTWQLLTKRPENVMRLIPADWQDALPANVWVGTSIENERWLHRVEILREIPTRIRFLSCEPLLGSIAGLDLAGVGWVIAGGESGSRRARPMHPDWVRELRDACAAASVPFFFKQWGSWSPGGVGDLLNTRISIAVRHRGGTLAPGAVAAGDEIMCWRGAQPKAGGKHVDGREWCEIPDPWVPGPAQLAVIA